MSEPLSIYMAGGLFNYKDLTGNSFLANYIEKESNGKYVAILPQDMEQTTQRSVDIRDQDLYSLMKCDLGLFNFDGTELDSGTVVEFIFAKFLDIPSVIVRSDFRLGGDQLKDGDDWNLMCSFYPRTHTVKLNAMEMYQGSKKADEDVFKTTERYYKTIASSVVKGFDDVILEPPISKGDLKDIERLYNWALDFPAGGLRSYSGNKDFVSELVSSKIKKGLL